MAEALVPGQRKFAAALSHYTGLDPRVVGAWLKSEQSGSAASGYEKRSYFNWLNIANTDSGPAKGSNSSVWRDPVTAAKATAEWMAGKGQIAREYGKPAAGIRAILGHAGKSPQEQINAIGNSGWATAPDYGSKIGALFHELAGDHALVHEAQRVGDPSLHDNAAAAAAAAAAGIGSSGAHAMLSGLGAGGPSPAQTADIVQMLQASLAPQQGASVAGTSLPRPQSSGGSYQSPTAPRVPAPLVPQAPASSTQDTVLGLLSKLSQDAAAPEAAAAEGEDPTAAPHTQVAEEHPGHYVNPLPGFVKGRTDQGVDYSSHPGAPIRAIGDGVVLPGQADWFKGQPYVQYRLTSGPQRGKVVFVAEQIAPQVKPGQRVRAGQRIGVYAPSGTAIETGFGSGRPGVPIDPYNGRPDGTETAGGKRARAFLERLGAR